MQMVVTHTLLHTDYLMLQVEVQPQVNKVHQIIILLVQTGQFVVVVLTKEMVEVVVLLLVALLDFVVPLQIKDKVEQVVKD